MRSSTQGRGVRTLKAWMRVITISGVVLAIFILLEIAGNRYNLRVDLSLGKDYTLSEQTRKIVKSIKDDIQFNVFCQVGDRLELEELFKKIAYYSPHIKYSLIDFDRNPGKAKVYGVTSHGQTIVEFQGKKETMLFPTENRVVNIILRLTRSRAKVVLFSKGHGERDINGDYIDVCDALRAENYEVGDVLLIEKRSIPEKCSVLIVAGPKKDFINSEIPLLLKYLKSGGKIIVLLDPLVELPVLEGFVSKHHIIFERNIIVDTKNKMFLGDPLVPLIPYYARHPLTDKMKSVSVFSTARSLRLIDKKDEIISVTPLARTGPDSWGKTNVGEIKELKYTVKFKKGVDKRGPLVVAAIARMNFTGKEKKEGELVCFGDTDFIEGKFLSMLGNKDLFLNTISWLTRNVELIATRSSNFEYPYHYMSDVQGKWLFWVVVVILPVLFLAIGAIAVMCRRRHI